MEPLSVPEEMLQRDSWIGRLEQAMEELCKDIKQSCTAHREKHRQVVARLQALQLEIIKANQEINWLSQPIPTRSTMDLPATHSSMVPTIVPYPSHYLQDQSLLPLRQTDNSFNTIASIRQGLDTRSIPRRFNVNGLERPTDAETISKRAFSYTSPRFSSSTSPGVANFPRTWLGAPDVPTSTVCVPKSPPYHSRLPVWSPTSRTTEYVPASPPYVPASPAPHDDSAPPRSGDQELSWYLLEQYRLHKNYDDDMVSIASSVTVKGERDNTTDEDDNESEDSEL